MKHLEAGPQLNELFAMKRKERPPENFMSEFIKEFHRRNDKAIPDFRCSILSVLPERLVLIA